MLNVLYEDNHIIVCIKEKGILSQEDISGKDDMLTIVKKYIKEKYLKEGNVYLGLVHRLDINTSGVMVFARTSKAASRLSKAINDNEFKKEYHALVEGRFESNTTQTIKSYLRKDEKERKAYIDDNGKYAELSFQPIKEYSIDNNMVTLINVKLKTGRFHQIRCQMASIGHPLYGDKKYGSLNPNDKYYLCAYSLSFPHPITKEIMTFTM
ncbi:MAG: RluA family pseudouridine synthase, partial [Acholeplasmatales bacterium]|nr:RluA family pseudouridine synthase [Acholeplasmatales bacterium]